MTALFDPAGVTPISIAERFFAAEPDLTRELIVDNFAGGGGASTGIFMATGRHPDIAINHDEAAICMHAANHPTTRHFCQNVWAVDPLEATGGRPVGLAWFSPDCKHFSKAKGGKPVERHIRDLAWVAVKWAKAVRPRVIMLENVEEFVTWGPLDDEGRPCKVRKGQIFDQWLAALKALGYRAEWRALKACDFGAPTIRKRFFLVARCDGRPIAWPEPTHAPLSVSEDGVVTAWARGHGLTLADIQSMKPWRTAAECIDWDEPCPSIFLTKEEGRALGCNRPLADATMARIARGVKRYVIDAAKPFLVNLTHHGGERTESLAQPARTITGAHRGEKALVAPYMVPRYGERPGQQPRARSIETPAPTVVPDGNGGSLVAPVLTYGQQGGAVRDPAAPHSTITASTKDTNQLVAAHLTKFSENSIGHQPDEPLHTVMAGAPRHGLVATHLTKFRGGATGQHPDAPMSTVTAKSFVKRPGGAPPDGVVAAFLAQHNAGPNEGVGARAPGAPRSTVTASGAQQAVVTAEAAHILNLKGADRRAGPADAPAVTVTAGGLHVAEVRAFLAKYYGTGDGQALGDPAHTVTTKDRFGLVCIEGEDFQIADIGMRMLKPRELFRAQGFPDSYIIDPVFHGKPLTKTQQVQKAGNSVCPDLARALVRANFPPSRAANDATATLAAE